MRTFLLWILLFQFNLFSHGISEADKEGMITGGALEYIWLGATHMLTGYDHLLFIFGVLFFLTSFKDVVRFISVFTLGHCLTLIFATFMEITANYYLVDAVIALTVIYKGFDNLDGFRKIFNVNSPNLLQLVFIFGLIHGFGLSTRLQQLPIAGDGLLIKILSFNIGVEVGQVIALSIMLLLLSAWRKTKSFERFSLTSNIVLMIAGFWLFLMQLHGFYNENKEPDQPLIEKYQSVTHQSNTVTLELKYGKSLEYKFLIAEGESLKYEWSTDQGEVYFDFHGDPKGGGKFKSYERATKSNSKGVITVPFYGSHGWYWKNKSKIDIKITLKTSGKYKLLGFQ